MQRNLTNCDQKLEQDGNVKAVHTQCSWLVGDKEASEN